MTPHRLLLLGTEVADPRIERDWDVRRVERTPRELLRALAELVSDHPPIVATWDARLPAPDPELLDEFAGSAADACHAGSQLYPPHAPRGLRFIAPATWHRLPADPCRETTSWRLCLHASFLRGELLQQCLAGASADFDTLAGTGLDWGMHIARAGGVIRNHPAILPGSPRLGVEGPTWSDELRFATRRYGRKWAMWAALRALRNGEAAGRDLAAARRAVRAESPVATAAYERPPHTARPAGDRVSVIIPTVGRYPMLRRLLAQLDQQTHRPVEVVVADQTPERERALDLGSGTALPLEVLHLPTPGQSTARNAAIRRTTGDVILFLDDDEEIPHDLVERHLEVYAETGADALAGGVDVPGDPRSDGGWRRVTDTFPGGHSSVRRTALAGSGLFDPVFDRGPRADADLGVRLHRSGAVILHCPDLRIVHHHAMEGGLRLIGARKVTRSSSRRSLLQRNLPAPTQNYLALRHWGEGDLREAVLMGLLTGLRHEGGRAASAARVVVQVCLLPSSLRRIRASVATAETMLRDRPAIPPLSSAARPESGRVGD